MVVSGKCRASLSNVSARPMGMMGASELERERQMMTDDDDASPSDGVFGLGLNGALDACMAAPDGEADAEDDSAVTRTFYWKPEDFPLEVATYMQTEDAWNSRSALHARAQMYGYKRMGFMKDRETPILPEAVDPDEHPENDMMEDEAVSREGRPDLLDHASSSSTAASGLLGTQKISEPLLDFSSEATQDTAAFAFDPIMPPASGSRSTPAPDITVTVASSPDEPSPGANAAADLSCLDMFDELPQDSDEATLHSCAPSALATGAMPAAFAVEPPAANGASAARVKLSAPIQNLSADAEPDDEPQDDWNVDWSTFTSQPPVASTAVGGI